MEPHLEVYQFVWNILAWSLTVSLLWPGMFPWITLAYKIWHGNKPIDEEFADEIWQRSMWASGLLFLAALGFVLLDYAIIDQLGMQSGPIHIVLYLGFLTVAGFIMYYCFYMEDFFQGLALAVICLYVPAALLFVLWLLIRWNWLFTYVRSWLIEPTA